MSLRTGDAFLCFKESGKESYMMASKFPDWNDFKVKAKESLQ